MKLFIPELNDLLRLTKDWEFDLYQEGRNESVIKKFLSKESEKREKEIQEKISDYITPELYEKNYFACNSDEREIKDKVARIRREIVSEPFQMTIKSGEILEVDRIYIRKGAEDFSSITFKWIVDKKTLRFWAKLEDVNNLYVEKEGKLDRWPEGKLSLGLSNKQPLLLCRTNNSFWGRKIAENGSVEKANWRDRYNNDGNELNSLEKLVKKAQLKNYPQKLIDEFVSKHKAFMLENK